MKWYNFKPNVPANRQKLPEQKKPVLVKLKNLDEEIGTLIVVGYLKYHAGIKSEPYFVTPCATINCPKGDDRVIAWCDCLPIDFNWV